MKQNINRVHPRVEKYLKNILQIVITVTNYNEDTLRYSKNRKPDLIAAKRLYCILANNLKYRNFEPNSISYQNIGSLIDISHSMVCIHISKANKKFRFERSNFVLNYINAVSIYDRTIEHVINYNLNFAAIDLIQLIKQKHYIELKILNEYYGYE